MTVNLLGFAGLLASRDFVATGNGAGIDITDATEAPALGDANLSLGGAGTNPSQARTITAVDGLGNPAIGITAQISVATTAGPSTTGIDYGAAGTAAAAATAAILSATPALAGGVLVEAGITGTFPLGLASAAGGGSGVYTVTVTLTVGGVVIATDETTVNVGGAPAVITIESITDNNGDEVKDDPKVGQGGALTIRLRVLDGSLTNPVANFTPFGGASVAPLGFFTAAGLTNDAGDLLVTYVSGLASGNSTLTMVVGTVQVQTVVEVGGTGGDVPTSLEAVNPEPDPAAVGDQVRIEVIAKKDGSPIASAIILFESNDASVTPRQASTNEDGVAEAFVTTDEAGEVVVTATAVTEGVTEVIPVEGVGTVVFHITFGGTTVELSSGATSTFLAWTGDEVDSSVFDGVGGLTIIWWWNGAEWLPFVPDSSIDALRAVFVLSTFDVIFIVTTGAVSVPI